MDSGELQCCCRMQPAHNMHCLLLHDTIQFRHIASLRSLLHTVDVRNHGGRVNKSAL